MEKKSKTETPTWTCSTWTYDAAEMTEEKIINLNREIRTCEAREKLWKRLLKTQREISKKQVEEREIQSLLNSGALETCQESLRYYKKKQEEATRTMTTFVIPHQKTRKKKK